ncbi:MAG: chorismate mutase [Alphaproteobacteria bacterium]|jgi:chorismate mutase|nr:chorismate mutase [Alphaproteobacteria bacterium]|tara:strand:- start:240 stop:1109 length:870 start_codon:yes stop_codon:yes gene_type:complete
MSSKSKALDDLRRRIDAIDDAVHDLLIERSELATEILAAKPPERDRGSAMHPGREAEVLRRLLDRHRGVLPAIVVADLWRGLMSAFVRLQGPLEVAVCAPEKSVGYWDLARAHFGTDAAMTLHRSPTVVLRAVTEGEGTVAVLPLPQEDDPAPWWQQLAADAPKAPRIIAKLPFVENRSSRFEDLGAFVVAPLDRQQTGQDRSLLVLATETPVSRARLVEQLTSIGLEGGALAVSERDSDQPEALYLIEIDDFVAKDDARVADFLEASDGSIDRMVSLGGYAVPYRNEE